MLVTRASNNYGPYQFPEKLIPLMISNALEDKPLPVYGDGHADPRLAVCGGPLPGDPHACLQKGREGEVYNIGGNRSLPNRTVVDQILKATGKPDSLIRYVGDRPGHDRRYALSSAKIAAETGWAPEVDFEAGLAATVDWYRQNTGWVQRVKSGEYQHFYAANYARR